MPMPTWVLRAREQPARLSSFPLCRPIAYPHAKSNIVPFIILRNGTWPAPCQPPNPSPHYDIECSPPPPHVMSCTQRAHQIPQTDGAAKNAPGDGAPSMATHAFQHSHTLLNLWSHSSCARVGALCIWELTRELNYVACLMFPCMGAPF